ncbi:hypothetical protein Fmac_031935 [Flemingia macrophylla]|uniref:Uncharacterized protein n=1 Tax=Flemingia macrophylla TaxID=520843 RepID=A0ABD1L3H5_9FABA
MPRRCFWCWVFPPPRQAWLNNLERDVLKLIHVMCGLSHTRHESLKVSLDIPDWM